MADDRSATTRRAHGGIVRMFVLNMPADAAFTPLIVNRTVDTPFRATR